MAETNKSAKSKEGTALTEQFFGQVSESIQLVFDLTSRIDERVKMLIEHQKEIDDQIEKINEILQNSGNRVTALEVKDLNAIQNDLKDLGKKVAIIISDDPQKELVEIRNKLHILEVRVENVLMRVGHHDNRWSQIFDAAWKIILMCIAGWILYKLGLQAPPN